MYMYVYIYIYIYICITKGVSSCNYSFLPRSTKRLPNASWRSALRCIQTSTDDAGDSNSDYRLR